MLPQSSYLLLVVDERSFRRAAVAAVLANWCDANEMIVEELDLSTPFDLAKPDECKAVIYSVGSEINTQKVTQTLTLLHGAYARQPIIVFADTSDPEGVRRAFAAGVRGFIPTDTAPEVVMGALSFILGGGTYVPPAVLTAEPPATTTPPRIGYTSPGPRQDDARAVDSHALDGNIDTTGLDDTSLRLTERQNQVLACLRRAQSNKEIARQLSMSEATVKVHVRHLMRKLGAANRTQIALIAAKGVRVVVHATTATDARSVVTPFRTVPPINLRN